MGVAEPARYLVERVDVAATPFAQPQEDSIMHPYTRSNRVQAATNMVGVEFGKFGKV